MPELPYESPLARYHELKDLSTADCGLPEISFAGDELVLRFKNWREDEHVFTFRDVIAYHWQDAMPLPRGVSWERAYEVTSSPWIARLAGTEAVTRGVAYRHWLFCFHPIEAAFEVLAGEMEMA